jgi:hypothetical protein
MRFIETSRESPRRLLEHDYDNRYKGGAGDVGFQHGAVAVAWCVPGTIETFLKKISRFFSQY